jgi:channel protein (hemolysin III family)
LNEILAIPGFSEPVSCWTHLLGAGAALTWGIPLVLRGRGRGLRVLALALFVFGAVFALSMSGVYHLLEPGGTPRAVLRRLDHAAIWAIIAGTFTAFHITAFRGPKGWAIAVAVWVIATTGITLKTVFFEDLPESLGLAFYLAMGWLGAATTLWARTELGWNVARFIVWGGLAYTAGAVVDFLRWPWLIPGVVGPHELFHLGVLAGLALHWRFIAQALRIDKTRELTEALRA